MQKLGGTTFNTATTGPQTITLATKAPDPAGCMIVVTAIPPTPPQNPPPGYVPPPIQYTPGAAWLGQVSADGATAFVGANSPCVVEIFG